MTQSLNNPEQSRNRSLPENRSNARKRNIPRFLALILAIIGLYILSRYNYPLFHSFADGITVFIAAGVFVLVWSRRQLLDNYYYLFVGIAFLFFAFWDSLHLLGNEGMGVFPQYGNLGPTLYIISRYFLSISMLVAPLFIRRKLNTVVTFIVYSAATILLILSVFYWRNFPVTYIEGVGLTPFKVISDYVICAILLVSLFLLVVNRHALDARVFRLVTYSFVLFIATGLAFTTYTDPFGATNALGHFFQIASFYLVYTAFLETVVVKPQDILYRNMKESEEKYHNLFNNMAEEVHFWKIERDQNGQIKTWRLVDANPPALKTWGKQTVEEIKGKTPDEIFGPGSTEHYMQVVLKVMSEGVPYSYEDYFPNLKKYFRFTTVPFGDYFITTGTDITTIKQAEEKLLTLERLAAIGQLSGSISHELKNPLAVIDSSAFYIENYLANSDEKTKRFLERMRNGVRRSVAIIDSLFNLTRMKEPEMHPCNINSLINDVIAENAPDTVTAVKEFPETKVIVPGDFELLRIAFRNIVVNAVQAMNGNGKLKVTIEVNGDNLEINFTDSGPGISPGNLEKIFQPLFTTKAQGLGFGLPITKNIVEKHYGTIEARTKLGEGTTVIICLPLAQKR